MHERGVRECCSKAVLPHACIISPRGAREDREAAARLLGDRGVEAGPSMVLVTAGGQHALHAAIHTRLRPGDVVCIGRYAYSATSRRLGASGLQLHVVPGDEEGMDFEALDTACQTGPVRALSIARPTTTPPPRRWIRAPPRHRRSRACMISPSSRTTLMGNCLARRCHRLRPSGRSEHGISPASPRSCRGACAPLICAPRWSRTRCGRRPNCTGRW